MMQESEVSKFVSSNMNNPNVRFFRNELLGTSVLKNLVIQLKLRKNDSLYVEFYYDKGKKSSLVVDI